MPDSTIVDLDIDMPLDEGISEAVLLLRSDGVETIESCQGGDGHAFPEATIRFCGGPAAGFHAYAAARKYNLPVKELRRVWSIDDGELTGPVWDMVFTTRPRQNR